MEEQHPIHRQLPSYEMGVFHSIINLKFDEFFGFFFNNYSDQSNMSNICNMIDN